VVRGAWSRCLFLLSAFQHLPFCLPSAFSIWPPAFRLPSFRLGAVPPDQPLADPWFGHGQAYHLVVLMNPPDDVVLHALNLVVHAVRKKTDEVEVGVLDQSDTASIAMAFRQAQPFYVAPDYHPPQSGSRAPDSRIYPMNKEPGIPRSSVARLREFLRANSTK
jgi:hypothetical protein